MGLRRTVSDGSNEKGVVRLGTDGAGQAVAGKISRPGLGDG